MTSRPDRTTRPCTLTAALLASALALTPSLATPAQAFLFGGGGRIVYDPRNHAENILSAARALDQINNQIAQLQNEAQMLLNDALNLEGLDHSALENLMASVEETRALLSEAQTIAFDVDAIEKAFTKDYGEAATQGTFGENVEAARARWQSSVAGFEDALNVQAGVAGNIEGYSAEMEALVDQSQGAVGALQVAQAGNQLLALQSAQLSDLIAAIAAQNSAVSLDAARLATAEAQGRENLARFLDYGADYAPGSVSLFSN
jgi:type IV secretion system protein TrbJ